MKKTGLKLLALLLALLLPMSAFAGAVEEFRKQNTDAGKVLQYDLTLETNPMLSALFGATEEDPIGDVAKLLRFTTQVKDANNGKFLFSMDGETILSVIAQKAASGELFVTIPELGELNFKLPAEMVKELTLKQEMQKNMKLDLNSLMNPPSSGDEKLDAAIKAILAKSTLEDVTEENPKFDKAAKVFTMPLENSDMLAVLESDLVAKQMKTVANGEKALETAKKLYGSDAMKLNVNAKFYVLEDGSIVALEMPVTVNAEKDKYNALMKEIRSENSTEMENDLAEDLNLNGYVNYYKKTDAVETHSFELALKKEDQGIEGSGQFIVDKDNYKLDAKISVLDGGNDNGMTVSGHNTWEGNKANGELNINVKSDENKFGLQVATTQELTADALKGSATIKAGPEGQAMEFATFHLSESYVDGYEAKDYSGSEAYDLSALNDEALQKIQEQVQASLQNVLVSLMSKMPASVQKMFMQGQGSESK